MNEAKSVTATKNPCEKPSKAYNANIIRIAISIQLKPTKGTDKLVINEKIFIFKDYNNY